MSTQLTIGIAVFYFFSGALSALMGFDVSGFTAIDGGQGHYTMRRLA